MGALCSVGKGWRWCFSPGEPGGLESCCSFRIKVWAFKLPGHLVRLVCSQRPRARRAHDCLPGGSVPLILPFILQATPHPGQAPSGSWLSHAESCPSPLLPRVGEWLCRGSLPPAIACFSLTPPAFPAQVL